MERGRACASYFHSNAGDALRPTRVDAASRSYSDPLLPKDSGKQSGRDIAAHHVCDRDPSYQEQNHGEPLHPEVFPVKLKNYKVSYARLVESKYWDRIIIAILAVGLVMASFALMNKSERVVLEPVTLTSKAWLGKNEASREYKTSWGSYLALLIGNVTPDKLNFIKKRIKPLLAPSIYDSTMQAFEQQAQDLRQNHVSMRFELNKVDYEPSTNKVFVYGYRYSHGSGTDKPIRSPRTYEFKIRVREFTPEVYFINTYEGRPRTQKVLRMMKNEKAHAQNDQGEQ